MDLINGEMSRIIGRYFGFVSTVSPSERKSTSVSLRKLGVLSEEIENAMDKTIRNYLEEQHEDGYWWYELESNVTITAEYLMLLQQ